MNTKFSKSDKPKGKFAQSNINLVYRGNASEIQSKPTLRSGGLQLVGKLQGTRRNPPPPPWVPSIKAEMGGQDTKINIVPPGGSGWGTGSSNNTVLENASKSDAKAASATPSALEGVSEPSVKATDDSKRSNFAESFQSTLVKPPQKPFFALRSSKNASGKSVIEGSPDIVRSLAGKATGPTIPFYQRPTASSLPNSISPKDPEVAEANADEKPIETKAMSSEIAAPRTGWAAVTTEEPDFQERINFSDGEEDVSKAPMVEVSSELPKSSIVSVASWGSSPIQPQAPAQVSYPRAAWDQSNCFNPVSPMQHTFNASFCSPNEGMFAESPISGARPDVLPSREVALLSEQLQRTSFTTSEAQVQAQREERTLAFKSAVNRAQMARKKRGDVEVIEPKRKDQSIDSTKSNLTDVSVFSQSIMQSGTAAIAGAPTFSMHAPVNHSPQHHNMEPMIAALYNNGFSSLMHSVASSNGHLASQMKPQAQLTGGLSPSSWNSGPFAANSQPPFMHPSYPLSNSPKLPTNQGFYFKSDHFAVNAFNQQSNPKSGHVQGLQPDRPIESSTHSYGSTVGESSVINHLPFQSAKPHITQHPSSSPTLEKRMESDSNKELIVSSLTRAVAINSHPLQISAHPEGSRTAFTPPAPSTIEAFPQQASHPQPVQQQPHITPLMEVNLSGKWSEKDFDTFPPPVSSRDNYARFRSGRGGSKNVNEERSGGHRYAAYNSSGRQNRGPPQRDAMRRSARRVLEMDGDRSDDRLVDEPVTESGEEQQGDMRRRRRDDNVSGTFPRQQRVRGLNRMPKANRGTLHDYDEGKQQNCDFDRQQTCPPYNQRDRWKSGSGCKSTKQGDRTTEKTNSAVPVGSRSRKNFPRSGLNDRRYAGQDDASKPHGRHSNQRRTDENAETANTTSQNDVDEVDANAPSDSERGTLTAQLAGSDSQFHSQRPQRGGSNSGRARRGQHGGSQRQPQRRGRTDRANTRRQNNRRHPDEDDDHDFKGGPPNTNVTSTTVATTTSSDGNAARGEGRANTESSGSTTSSGQQPGGAADAVQSCGTNIFASGTKSRSHAHSITLASDVEVWETASEGFSSSLLGTSPGCSFADCTSVSPTAGTAKANDHKDPVAADGDDYEEGGYGRPPKRTAHRRSALKITGKIVPLMSINAEAPPSYCDNPSFLDSPMPTVKSSSNDTALGGPTAEVKDVESVAESASTSSEDGFMEVRSKSSRKQQKAKLQQKSHKSSVSSDERSSTVRTKNRDLVKSRVQPFVLSKPDQKPSKPSKHDETSAKDKQRSTSTTAAATPANSSQTSTKHSEPAAKKLSNPTMTQQANAWLKPLQETINEKAAAAAALAAQNGTKSTTVSSDTVTSSTKVAVSTTVSSYAWSVVVGSRTTATSTSCTPSENVPVPLMAKTSEKVVTPKSMQNATSDHPPTVAVAGSPQPLTMPTELESSVIPQSRQSKIEEKSSQDESVTQLSDPPGASAPNTPTAAATSANVCKVRPQKQPTNAAIAISSTAPAAQAPKPELTTFPISAAYSTPGNTVLINTSQLRRPIGDAGDWIGKTPGIYTSNSSSVLFDGYGSKKLETAPESSLGLAPAATAAAAMYLQQHQQQPFRQTLHPLQQQQPMMGFGLPDLTVRHQNNRMSGTCSQNGMGTEGYFTVPPFGTGNAGQTGAQQPPRSLYPPAPPAQQRGFPSWQHQQHHSQQEAAAMAAAVAGAVAPQAAALWSSNYTPSPPPPPHHHPSYVGVIGADRPSSTSSVSITSRLQSSNTSAPLYGSGSIRGGSATTPGVGGPPFAQPAPPPQPPPQAASMPPPSGLYASSPTHPTPPPHLPFDPNFAYTSGGLANSTSVFSHHSGAAGGPAILAAPHRQSASARSLGDHPHASHPPVFINASHTPFPAPPAAISVHGLAGPPPAPMTTPGLHF